MLRVLHPFDTDAGWTYLVEDGCGHTDDADGATFIAELFFPGSTRHLAVIPRVELLAAAELLAASHPLMARHLRNAAGYPEPDVCGSAGPSPVASPAGDAAGTQQETAA